MKRFGIFVAMLLLGGCLGGYSPESRFYSLGTIKTTTELKTKDLSVGINEVELPDYLNRPQIVFVNENSSQIEIAREDRWAEALTSMIQRVVAEDMSEILPKAQVVAKASLLENFDRIVDIQIVRFDIVENKKVVLEAWWYIKDSERNVLKKGKTSIMREAEGGYNKYIAAMNELLMEMSLDIAKKIAK